MWTGHFGSHGNFRSFLPSRKRSRVTNDHFANRGKSRILHHQQRHPWAAWRWAAILVMVHKSGSPVEVGSLFPHDLRFLFSIPARWLFGISWSINSSTNHGCRRIFFLTVKLQLSTSTETSMIPKLDKAWRSH